MKKSMMIACVLMQVCFAQAATTLDAGHPYAYGANTGWINGAADGTNGAVIGRFFCSGYLYSANLGWISLGAGDPADHMAYSNTSVADYGVNHDGQGSLRGYAYSANTGWIAFEEQGNPRVNLTTGNLTGYAYGANTGWISLSNAQAYVRTARLDAGPDTDADGLPDAWEYQLTGTTRTLQGDGADLDGDGVSDWDEFRMGTDPDDADSFLYVEMSAAGGTTNQLAWPTQPTRHYQLQSVTALTGQWQNAQSGVLAGTGGMLNVPDVPGTNSPALFYRVKVILPLE